MPPSFINSKTKNRNEQQQTPVRELIEQRDGKKKMK